MKTFASFQADEDLVIHLRAQLDCKTKELFIVKRTTVNSNENPGTSPNHDGN